MGGVGGGAPHPGHGNDHFLIRKVPKTHVPEGLQRSLPSSFDAEFNSDPTSYVCQPPSSPTDPRKQRFFGPIPTLPTHGATESPGLVTLNSLPLKAITLALLKEIYHIPSWANVMASIRRPITVTGPAISVAPCMVGMGQKNLCFRGSVG